MIATALLFVVVVQLAIIGGHVYYIRKMMEKRGEK